MSQSTPPSLPKWPFFAAAAVLLAAAGHVAVRSPHSFEPVTLVSWLLTLLVGTALVMIPFRLEYKALTRLVEVDLLTSAAQQLQQLETVARSVTAATAQWSNVQEQAGATQKAAREMAERVMVEARSVAESLQRTQETEKATLRLEAEKLRRAESDWMQVVVGLLDHIFALHQAAAQSGRMDVIQQLTVFQNACRDIARRVGVTQIEAHPGEPFDENIHRLPKGGPMPPTGALVEGVLAPGVAFQGRLLRPAIVLVKGPEPALPPPADEAHTSESAGPAEKESALAEAGPEPATLAAEPLSPAPATDPATPPGAAQEDLL